MTKVLVTEAYLDNIADAIREKRGVLTEYKPSQMAGAIMDIDTHDTHDATASAGDVLTGKTAYIATGKVSGTMPNQGAIAGMIDAENPSYTVPEGYHSGLGTVSADVATTAEVEAYVGRIKKLAPKTITENGTYDAEDDNVGGYSRVTVNVSGGGGIPLLTQAQWDALTPNQKRAYGLVAIQNAISGYNRGDLVYGADFIGSILQSGTAASSASVNVTVTGTYKLIVIALNSEASTNGLTISASLNNTALTGENLAYNQYSGSGNDRRNYRVNAYDIEVESGDTIAIDLTDRSGYTSFVYAITDANITEIVQRRSTADDTCSGSYSSDAIVLQGTFNGSSGGTINLQAYTANTTIQTENPGSNYKSAYIFWCD